MKYNITKTEHESNKQDYSGIPLIMIMYMYHLAVLSLFLFWLQNRNQKEGGSIYGNSSMAHSKTTLSEKFTLLLVSLLRLGLKELHFCVGFLFCVSTDCL